MRRTALAIVLALFTASAQAVTITRGPYLGRPDDRSVAIAWRTDVPADSRVDYALDGSEEWTTLQSTDALTEHRVTLDGLVPGALYRYRVFSGGVALAPESRFRSPRDESQQEFTFAVIGDTNRRFIPAVIAERLVEAEPDFAIHTGDVVYPAGSDDLYDDEYFRPFAPFLRQAAVLPTFGNHDTVTERGAPLLRNFVLPSSGTSAGSRFYSFRHGHALFVSVDIETSSFGAGSLQYGWLRRQLEESEATWKFVYVHQPPYSSDRSNAFVRMILGPLFERYGVDIVFSGNAHLYERTHPICDFGVPRCKGVVYITEGGGGARFSNFRRQKFTAFVKNRHGYTLVSIAGERLRLTSHDLDGSVVDSLELKR
ncbi:MAG TPA: metallophosphoesterase family protein [Thermoanaerobaculia bacterium]|nr:metallophosphoesterase family protein [Thermoanaerobaculia bacterium]